eukprot:403362819
MNRRQQVRNIKTAGDLTTSRARGNINKQDESMLDQAESSFITKPRQYSNLRGSYQHIYYNEGIPKTLLNKKLEKSNKNFQISLSNKNKSQASAYLQNNVDISKDKLDFARADLIALDADTLEKKLQQNTRNLQKDSQYAIDQAKINFERAGHLKLKLEQIMSKCREMKTLSASNQSSIQVQNSRGQSDLNSKMQSLNVQSRAVQNNTFQQLREQELKDIDTLFRKLTNQLNSYDQHLAQLSKMNDLEMLEFKLQQFGVQLSQVQNHIKDEESKLTQNEIQQNQAQAKDDINYKQMKTLNDALNRRAVMNQIAEEFEQNSQPINKDKSKEIKRGKRVKDAKMNWQAKVQSKLDKKKASQINEYSDQQINATYVEKSDHTKTVTIMSQDQDSSRYWGVRKDIDKNLKDEDNNSFTSSCDSESQEDDSSFREKQILQHNQAQDSHQEILSANIKLDILNTIKQNQNLITKRRQLDRQPEMQKSKNHFQLTQDGSRVFRIEDESSYQQLNKSMENIVSKKPLFLVRQMEPKIEKQSAQEKLKELIHKRKLEEEQKNQSNKVMKVSTQFIKESHQLDLINIDIKNDQMAMTRRNARIETEQSYEDSTKGELWLFRGTQTEKIVNNLNGLDNNKRLFISENLDSGQLKQIPEFENIDINSIGINNNQILVSYRQETNDDIYQIGYMQPNTQEKLPPQKQVLYYEKINFLGDYHVIALAQNFKAYTWGSNSHGQLAQSISNTNSKTNLPNENDIPFIKHPHQINYFNQVHQVCAYGNSTAILDELNNLLTCGNNGHGQLGHNDDSYDFSDLLQRANKDLIIEEVVQLRGFHNTFSFLTKSQEIYVCGEFNIPLEGKAELKKGREYEQIIYKPSRIRFLFDKKIRYKILNYQINKNNLVLLTDIDPYCSKVKLI